MYRFRILTVALASLTVSLASHQNALAQFAPSPDAAETSAAGVHLDARTAEILATLLGIFNATGTANSNRPQCDTSRSLDISVDRGEDSIDAQLDWQLRRGDRAIDRGTTTVQGRRTDSDGFSLEINTTGLPATDSGNCVGAQQISIDID
jgi:hypothetical protein